ncbi:MAG: phosphonate ABC transporter, permease protein PhnE [Gammaproteobacteria bacterium]|nr:phosphonate ABC transporter, permease protein PhnE [Gammaproteobacteria bacterium]TVQ49975.1 MAG: phosphonate ABC transporter, permease protein PhnE [Gammaproteobacteria bacterium]
MNRTAAVVGVPWRRPPLITNPWLRRGLFIGVPLYLFVAFGTLEINWARVAAGMPRALEFLGALASPDFVSRGDQIIDGVLESLTMTVVATFLGFLLSVPIALGAARNLAPAPVYLFCRAIIAISRSFQEIIIAILLVAMLGFGPLAGVATLAFASIGFIAKLAAEEIEAMDPRPLEAIRATGGSWLQRVHWAVQPQVLPRVAGITLYRLDINFRESAIIGIVGAGGIGATLNTAFDRYEFDTAAAILLVIIVIVLAAEYASGWLRGRLR